MKMGTIRRCVAVLAIIGGVAFLSADHVSSQDPSIKPTFGSVKLKTGFVPDPFKKDLVAGGEIKTNKENVKAYIADAPDFVLDFAAGDLPLTIYAESKADTTLLIKGPDGKWFANDDGPGTGLNPLIKFDNPKSGKYIIWVGTFDKEMAPAVLKITELKFPK